MEKVNNTPSLRFPEFTDDWELKKLGDIMKMQAGKFINASDIKEEDNQNQFPCYGGNGLRGFTQSYNQNGKYSLIGRQGAHCGNVKLANGKFYATEHAVVVNLIDGYDIHYIYYVLNNLNLNQFSTGLAQPGLSVQNLEKVETVISLFLPEQTKIANFLTAVDEKLQALKQKKTLLEQYKKGVMQQIFSQELRFKDDNGDDYPDWEEKKLGEKSKITTGKLDANAMVENGEFRFYTCAKDYYKIDKYAFDTEALLISGNGANVGYIHYYKGKFNAYQRTYVLDRIEDNIIFIKYFLDHFLYLRINSEKKEGNTPYIVMSTLSEMEIQLPCIEEQTKIANFLSAIDDKINHCQSQIANTAVWKKGLLQKMFV